MIATYMSLEKKQHCNVDPFVVQISGTTQNAAKIITLTLLTISRAMWELQGKIWDPISSH